MDEDVTDQTAGVPQSGPAAAAGGGTVIEAFPGELGAGGAIARAVAHVEIGFDGEKRNFTVVLATEGNVRRSAQVDLVPIDLGQPPELGLAQPATLLIQPKASSMRLRTRWLAA